MSLEDQVAELTGEIRQLRAEVGQLKGAFAKSNDKLVDVDEAATLLKMSPAALRKAAARGTIPCERIGRRLRFHTAELMGARE